MGPGNLIAGLHQVELHPYNPSHELKKYCDEKGIFLQAYCPLGSTSTSTSPWQLHLSLMSEDSPLLKDPELQKIADKHGVSTSTVLISWSVSRGVIVLPKSVTPKRESGYSGYSCEEMCADLIVGIEQNLKVVKLDEEDMKTLNSMAEGGKQQRVNTPPWNTDFVGHLYMLQLVDELIKSLGFP